MHVTNTKDFKCSGEPHFQTGHCTEFEELALDFKGANYLAITRLVLRKRLGRVNGTHWSLRSVFLINTRCTVVNVTRSLWGAAEVQKYSCKEKLSEKKFMHSE